MPYWVRQKSGPIAARVRRALDHYQCEKISALDAWIELADVYQEVRGTYFERHEGPESHYRKHLRRGTVNYMITCWFPRYANMWASDGPLDEMRGIARRLEIENPNTVFEVCYEY